MNLIEAKELLVSQTHRYLDKAERLYRCKIDPKISFDLKGSTIGEADYGKNLIRYNLEALKVGGWGHLFNETVPHEVAHLVQYRLWSHDRRLNPPHGRRWKEVMKAFGKEPSRCHSIDLPKRKVTQYAYRCGCRTVQFSAHRNTKIRNGKKYWCVYCDGLFKPY